MVEKQQIQFERYTNLPLGGNWAGEWPAYVLVHHEGAVDDVRYVPERTCRGGGGGAMSAVEYTRCDAAGCGRVTPDEPGSPYMEPGWARLAIAGVGEYDLCPDCARKAMEAVGVEEER